MLQFAVWYCDSVPIRVIKILYFPNGAPVFLLAESKFNKGVLCVPEPATDCAKTGNAFVCDTAFN